MDPPNKIVWFYGRHQPYLFPSWIKKYLCIEFYKGLPMNIKVLFDRSKQNICIIYDLMQTASENQFDENLFTNGRHLNMSFLSVKIYFLWERKA